MGSNRHIDFKHTLTCYVLPQKPYDASSSNIGDDGLEDDVFFANRRDHSPEFFDLSESQATYSHRNSLSSISELANDEEVARFMSHDARYPPAGLTCDPRFELFCKWLETQNGKQGMGDENENTKGSDLSLAGEEEFHDAEKEQTPPAAEVMQPTCEDSKNEMVIPMISLPKDSSPQETESVTKSDQSSMDETTQNCIVVSDPVKLQRKLHSPKKGRAPPPPTTLFKPVSHEAIPESINLHKETVL